jgi:alkane 1-monooxygenase
MTDIPQTVSPTSVARLSAALPFAVSLLMIPVILAAAALGGWWLLIVPGFAWALHGVLDAAIGLNEDNANPDTPREDLFWYTLITRIWLPLQCALVFGLIYAATKGALLDHLGTLEKVGLFFGVGVATGTVGIVYSHELMHQRSRLDRWLADLLLAMVLYSHFRSEHLLVHHRYVATPKDAVTARYNEGFHRYYPRVLRACWHSAFAAEAGMLARKGLCWTHRTNPFWRYWALQAGMLALAFALGGWAGIGLFAVQAGTAIWQLELVNYVEHYGLTRKHLGEGRYEHVKPHHSWNATQKASNWLLINLQRHSDHHAKPDRPFPLLQTYGPEAAPQLPYGYPVMTVLALVPPLWLRVMNPRVQSWRRQHYPEIKDWTTYKAASNPMPR